MRRNPATVHQWYNRIAVLGQHIVQLGGNLAAFCKIAGLAQFIQQRVIGEFTELLDILALPLVFRLWLIAAKIHRQMSLGICAVKRVGVHFDIGVEFLKRIGTAGITTKED